MFKPLLYKKYVCIFIALAPSVSDDPITVFGRTVGLHEPRPPIATGATPAPKDSLAGDKVALLSLNRFILLIYVVHAIVLPSWATKLQVQLTAEDRVRSRNFHCRSGNLSGTYVAGM